MEDIDDLIDTARDKAETFLNAGQRSWQHVALGALLAAGFTVAVTVLAKDAVPRGSSRGMARHMGNEVRAGNLLLPAVFSTNTLSALRVWNAPRGKTRYVAMGLWALAQTSNAWWLAARPKRLWPQIAAAMTSAGLAAAFAYEARRIAVNAPVDPAAQAQTLIRRAQK